jgi:hypothetical protein
MSLLLSQHFSSHMESQPNQMESQPNHDSQNEIDAEFPDDMTDEQAKHRVSLLAFPNQLEWEIRSSTFREILIRLNWWELSFAQRHPSTYERLKKSIARRSNAQQFASLVDVKKHSSSPNTNVWRSLLIKISQSDSVDRLVVNCTQISINPADEFGVDISHEIVRDDRGQPLIRVSSPQTTTTRHYNDLMQEAFCGSKNSTMEVENLWTISFQDSVMILLRNSKTGHRELVWIRTPLQNQHQNQTNRDPSLWAINHNTLAETPDDFKSPPYLDGDASLDGHQPLFLSTEGRTDIPNVKNACAAVFVRHRDLLIFDQVSMPSPPPLTGPKHWRQLLTHEQSEPRRIPIASACFIFDSMILYASHDGVLRAHPRGNPFSTYHVENVGSLVPHLTGLYNIVALIHSYHILEVRLVTRIEYDPFVAFKIMYSSVGVDCNHKPLLYGPYVIFAGIDGCWYRVMYDLPELKAEHAKHKELITIPHQGDWKIVAVKNANWRLWTVTLHDPRNQVFTDCQL